MARKAFQPGRIYRSPDGRIEIIRADWWDFELYLDSEFVKSYERRDDAEHHAAMWLEKQAQRLAVYEVAA